MWKVSVTTDTFHYGQPTRSKGSRFSAWALCFGKFTHRSSVRHIGVTPAWHPFGVSTGAPYVVRSPQAPSPVPAPESHARFRSVSVAGRHRRTRARALDRRRPPS